MALVRRPRRIAVLAAALIAGPLATAPSGAHAADPAPSTLSGLTILYEGRPAYGTTACLTATWDATLSGPARKAAAKDGKAGEEVSYDIGITVADAESTLGQVRVTQAYLFGGGGLRMTVDCEALETLAAAGYGTDGRDLTLEVTDGSVTTSSGTYSLTSSTSVSAAHRFRILLPGRVRRSGDTVRIAGRVLAWARTSDTAGWVAAPRTRVDYTARCRGEADPVRRTTRTGADGGFDVRSTIRLARTNVWLYVRQTGDEAASGGSWIRRKGTWLGPFGDGDCQRI